MAQIKMTKNINDWKYTANVDLTIKKMHLEILPKKHIPIPKKLVKFYDVNNYSVDALTNNYLYTSHPFELNDPFGCFYKLVLFEDIPLDMCIRFMHIFNNPEDKVTELFETNRKKLYATMESIYYDYIYSMMGIVSMTKNQLDIKMWAYYTGHKGFQVSFKTKNLSKKLHGPFPINYTASSEAIKFSDNIFISALYQTNIKSKSWQPENEWRFIYESFDRMRLPNHQELWDKFKERKVYYNQSDINEVVLGFSFFDRSYCSDYSDGVATYDYSKTSDNVQTIKLLQYLVDNKIHVSLIHLKDDLNFELAKKQISITKKKDGVFSYKRLQ